MNKYLFVLLTGFTALWSGTSLCHAQSGIIFTISGNGTPGYYGDALPATTAILHDPDGVAIDAAGNIYFADYSNYRVRKISPAGIMSTVAGNGTIGFSGDGFAATNAQLNRVTSVAVDGIGNIFIADGDNNCIRKVNTAGIITTVAGVGGSTGSSGDGFPATNALMNGTYGVAADHSGNIYIGDYNNSRIRKVNPAGIITTIAGTGIPGFSGDGFAATSANIHFPYSVAADTLGNVFFTDRANQRVRKINAGGIISTVAGNGSPGYSGDGAAATLAQLNDPTSVSVDAAGNLYISEYANNVVRKVNTASIISTLAGTGSPGFSGDGGYATACKFNEASGLAVDSYGNIVISDQLNQRLRKITPSITVTGLNILCAGATISLADSTPGGTWTSSGPAATVGSVSGIVTGVSGGSVTITYSIGSVFAIKAVTVQPAPAAITGIDSVCVGHTRTLADATPGGVWSSATTTIATVGPSSGIVTGVAAGMSVITYLLPDGCSTTVSFKVVALPCMYLEANETLPAGREFAIYPNPATEELTIKTALGTYMAFDITNNVGQIITRNDIGNAETTVDLKSLAPGVYYVRLTGNNGLRVAQFVKQ